MSILNTKEVLLSKVAQMSGQELLPAGCPCNTMPDHTSLQHALYSKHAGELVFLHDSVHQVLCSTALQCCPYLSFTTLHVSFLIKH